MKDTNIDISELYYDSTISGESYLYCVENGINTISDLCACDVANAPEMVFVELNTIISECKQKTDINNEDATVSSTDEIYGSLSQLDCAEVYALTLELTLDVRATNIIKNILAYCNDNLESFASFFMACTYRELMQFRNCGRKTIDIILETRDYISSNYSIQKFKEYNIEHNIVECKRTYNKRYDTIQRELSKKQIAILTPIWRDKLAKLSKRAANVLTNCYEGQEWYQVFYKLTSPTFDFYKCRNCGKQTAEELTNFIKEISEINLDDLSEIDEKAIAKAEKAERYSQILNLSENSIFEIVCIEEKLNRFPLLLAIQKYIEELESRNKIILDGLIDIYNGQELVSRDKLSVELSLTTERLRQLRNRVFYNLKAYIRDISQHVEVFDYALNATTKYNEEEGTNFQENFIYLTISLCSNRWTIIGDVEEVFYNPYGHQVNLNIVSTDFAKEFDFPKFLRAFDDVYKSKRTADTEITLASFCRDYFKREIQIAILNDIVHECKKIIFRLYDCPSRDDIILLGSNAYKGQPEAIEEILQKNGKPMSAEDIYQVMQDNYPDIKCKGVSSIISAIGRNPNILPVSRSGVYVLKDWNDAQYRGGTIRDYCEEFLLNSTEQIATIEDIGNYVRGFRPSTSDSSIQSNLLSEANKKFSLYTKDDVKYIGFSSKDYDDAYVLVSDNSWRPFGVSRRMFEEFIVTNDRFPFASGDDIAEEERRLGRFWQNLQNKIRRGGASDEELEMVKHIEATYPNKNMPKNEYKWRNSYENICSTLRMGDKGFLSDADQRWCYKNIQKLKSGQLESWQVSLMLNLEELYVKG